MWYWQEFQVTLLHLSSNGWEKSEFIVLVQQILVEGWKTADGQDLISGSPGVSITHFEINRDPCGSLLKWKMTGNGCELMQFEQILVARCFDTCVWWTSHWDALGLANIYMHTRYLSNPTWKLRKKNKQTNNALEAGAAPWSIKESKLNIFYNGFKERDFPSSWKECCLQLSSQSCCG